MPSTPRRCLATLLFALLPWDLALAADSPETSSAGPSRGALVLIGGGHVSEGIHQRMRELVGGGDVPVVILPGAAPDGALTRDGAFDDMVAWMARNGWSNSTVLHTRSPEEASEDAFLVPLREAKLVWISGGRQWRLADAYLGTELVTELRRLLERGGVIAGTSAGATIQGSFLARGDTRTNTVMMGDHQVGFGFLPNTAVDQHLLARNRQFDMLEIRRAHPELLGIGLDEDAALLVQGDYAEVLGESRVAIYDGSFWSPDELEIERLPPDSDRFYLLSPGQRYNLKKRVLVRPVGPQLEAAMAQGADAALKRWRELKDGGGEFVLDEPGLNRFGYRLMAAGRADAAVKVLRRVTELHPESSNAWDSLGEALLRAGRAERARRSYERSLQLDPDNDNARRAIASIGSSLGESDKKSR